jgi:hypothetical protein
MSHIDPPAVYWWSAKHMERSLADYLWRETMKVIDNPQAMEALAADLIQRHPHLADCIMDFGKQFTIVNLVDISEQESVEAYNGSW